MLLEHDTIYTGPGGERTDALLMRDGRVEALGEEARRRAGGSEESVEAPGECLVPGLADAHCHLWGVGRRLGTIDLSGSESPDDLFERLRADQASLEAGPDDWVLGQGWDEHRWDAEEVEEFSRERLDDLFPERAVCLHRVDSHAVMCNTEALRRGGLIGTGVSQSELREQVESAGGRIDRDAAGDPNGRLVDAAMRPVLNAIPEPTREEDETLMRRAADRMLEMGITSVHLARVEVDRVEMLRELERSGDLPLRMYALVDGMDPDLPDVLQQGPSHDSQAQLSVAGIKLFADGAMGSKGALLLGEYSDGSRGLEDVGEDELCAKAVSWMGNGWQVAVHAIGDRANRRVVNAYDLVPATVREQVRPRIEHAQMLTDRDLERVGEAGILASIQPIHMRSDATWVDELLSSEQQRRLFRWRELQDCTVLAGGSDFPIADANPWHGMATARSRHAADGTAFQPGGDIDQSLSASEAMAAYTTGAAHAAHWEDHLGQLRAGMSADVVAVDTDPFVASPGEVWETDVLEVWLGGRPQLDKEDERC